MALCTADRIRLFTRNGHDRTGRIATRSWSRRRRRCACARALRPAALDECFRSSNHIRFERSHRAFNRGALEKTTGLHATTISSRSIIGLRAYRIPKIHMNPYYDIWNRPSSIGTHSCLRSIRSRSAFPMPSSMP
jgi:hypothetical protein